MSALYRYERLRCRRALAPLLLMLVLQSCALTRPASRPIVSADAAAREASYTIEPGDLQREPPEPVRDADAPQLKMILRRLPPEGQEAGKP